MPTAKGLIVEISMSAGEIAYLIFVLDAMTAFSVELAWRTWRYDKGR